MTPCDFCCAVKPLYKSVITSSNGAILELSLCSQKCLDNYLVKLTSKSYKNRKRHEV